jgi:hypothetical protein
MGSKPSSAPSTKSISPSLIRVLRAGDIKGASDRPFVRSNGTTAAPLGAKPRRLEQSEDRRQAGHREFGARPGMGRFRGERPRRTGRTTGQLPPWHLGQLQLIDLAQGPRDLTAATIDNAYTDLIAAFQYMRRAAPQDRQCGLTLRPPR